MYLENCYAFESLHGLYSDSLLEKRESSIVWILVVSCCCLLSCGQITRERNSLMLKGVVYVPNMHALYIQSRIQQCMNRCIICMYNSPNTTLLMHSSFKQYIISFKMLPHTHVYPNVLLVSKYFLSVAQQFSPPPPRGGGTAGQVHLVSSRDIAVDVS